MAISWNDDLERYGDRELDREIVELLGWRIITLDEPEVIEHEHAGKPYRTLLTAYMADENGQRVSENWHDERSVIEHAWIPDISSDLRELERVVPHLNVQKFTIEYYSQQWVATITTDGKQWLVAHDEPALAAATVIRDYLKNQAR